MTLLTLLLLLAGASAQKKGKATLVDGQPLRRLDSLQLDSVYRYWDNFVTEHPKDEKAWRELIEVEHEMVVHRLIVYRKEKQGDNFGITFLICLLF